MDIINIGECYSVKIVQIFPMENNECFQGHILGLGDDGVVYIDDHRHDKSGWNVYVEDLFTGSQD